MITLRSQLPPINILMVLLDNILLSIPRYIFIALLFSKGRVYCTYVRHQKAKVFMSWPHLCRLHKCQCYLLVSSLVSCCHRGSMCQVWLPKAVEPLVCECFLTELYGLVDCFSHVHSSAPLHSTIGRNLTIWSSHTGSSNSSWIPPLEYPLLNIPWVLRL